MPTILQRVCWNTYSWQKASGETIDSGNPGKRGYGNEEWNFCKDDEVDGSVFGWLYWPAKRYADKTFQILFWTISPRREWLIVGAYLAASLATNEELRKLRSVFSKKGISERRLSEALDVVRPGQRANVRKHPPTKPESLKFKCPVSKVHVFEPPVPYNAMPRRFRSKNARFKNPTIFSEPIEKLLGLALNKPHPNANYPALPLIEEVYARATPASLKIIIPRHKRLSNEFVAWLKKKRHKVLSREKDFVDVKFADGPSVCLAELKVCYGMTAKAAIREALGQILEYNYYGWREPADRWFIVLDSAPSPYDREYVSRLSKAKKMPLRLLWRAGDGFIGADGFS